MNATIVDTIEAIIERGRREGIFHAQRARGRRAHADERAVLLSRVESAYVRRDIPARLPFAGASGGRTRKWSPTSSFTVAKHG